MMYPFLSFQYFVLLYGAWTLLYGCILYGIILLLKKPKELSIVSDPPKMSTEKIPSYNSTIILYIVGAVIVALTSFKIAFYTEAMTS